MNTTEQIRERLGTSISEWREASLRRIYFSVPREKLVEVARVLFHELHLRFVIASGLETDSGFEILYHFGDDSAGVIYSARVRIEGKDAPAVDSLAPLFKGAEWIEREMWEMLGIQFTGHPNLKRLLLPDDWPDGEYPLRKKGNEKNNGA